MTDPGWLWLLHLVQPRESIPGLQAGSGERNHGGFPGGETTGRGQLQGAGGRHGRRWLDVEARASQPEKRRNDVLLGHSEKFSLAFSTGVKDRLCTIGGCDAEIYNMIAVRFKRESPVGRSIFVSMANGSGNSGYVPDDSAFGQQTFEVLSSRCKPGYAESAIVNGLLDLIAELKR